jgi:hypothetical protein
MHFMKIWLITWLSWIQEIHKKKTRYCRKMKVEILVMKVWMKKLVKRYKKTIRDCLKRVLTWMTLGYCNNLITCITIIILIRLIESHNNLIAIQVDKKDHRFKDRGFRSSCLKKGIWNLIEILINNRLLNSSRCLLVGLESLNELLY